MGIWVSIAIGLFVLGSIMALKPHGIDVRLDKLRMTARRLDLNPKVITCPDWIKGRDNEYGKGMLGQYALIIDGMKLPNTKYHVINGELRSFNSAEPKLAEPKLAEMVNTSNASSSLVKVNASETYTSKSIESSQSANRNPPSDISKDSHNHRNLNGSTSNFTLDKVPLTLPKAIAPFVKGVSTKANHIIVYWDDTGYVKPNSNPSYNETQIEPDLQQLKDKMQDWAEKLSSSNS